MDLNLVTDLISEEYHKDVIFLHLQCAENVETVQTLLLALPAPTAHHHPPDEQVYGDEQSGPGRETTELSYRRN